MANGQFLKDVSSGIFNRLRELDREQQVKDEKSKLQTIELLSGLAGQVEPDSLPLLMSQIGQTIGVKGKLKGFWDAFSGMPNRSMEDQLGTIMNQATSSLVGPQEAKQARQTYKGELLQPFRDAGTRPRSAEALPYKTPPTLADRLILRDPRQEKLEELDARYGAQLENQRVMQNERYQDALGRAKYSSDLKLQELNAKNQADSMKALNALSTQLLAGDKSLTPEQSIEKAGDILGSTAESKRDALRALAPLRVAQATQAQAIASSMKKSGGKTPSQQLSEQRFTASQEKELRGMEDDLAKSEAIVRDLTPKIQDVERSLDNTAKKFKMTRQEILSSDAFSIASPTGPIGEMVQEYRKLLASKATAEAEMNTKRKQVEEFKKKYEKGVTPPKAQKSMSRALGPGERVGMGTQGIRVSEAQGKAEGYFPGDKRTVGGKSYTVRELRNGFWVLDPVTNK